MFMLPVFILKNSIILLFLFFREFPVCRLVVVEGGGAKVLGGLVCDGGGGIVCEGVGGGGRGNLSMQLSEGGIPK